MALTAAQITDCRRFMGYGLAGTSSAFTPPIYAWPVGWPMLSLEDRLASLQASEETVLTVTYLTPLATLEAAIVTAAGNLDTNKAAVWERNPQEVQDRTNLFNQIRRNLCAFLGFEPGPALSGGGSIKLVRC